MAAVFLWWEIPLRKTIDGVRKEETVRDDRRYHELLRQEFGIEI